MSDEIARMNQVFESFTAGKGDNPRTSISLEALEVLKAMHAAINALDARTSGFLGRDSVLGAKNILE